MRSDVDNLMEQRNIDAIFILGRPSLSRDMAYMAGPLKITGGYLVKVRGEEPFLVVGQMERDEAAKSGLRVSLFSEFGWEQILKERGSGVSARVEMIKRILEPASPKRVAFYGVGHIGDLAALIDALKQAPFEALFEEEHKSLLNIARMTKDEEEINRIKEVSRKATEVFDRTVKLLSSCSVEEGEELVYKGEVLTIGVVKRFIKAWCDELDIDVSVEEVIFAQGYDAAVPHSRGTDHQVLKVGKTIVFDFCPCEKGGGYFTDITRTFCVGRVDDEVRLVWRRVLDVQTRILSELRVGESAFRYDEICSSMFEEWGYATPRKKPGTQSGYVHGLGHGVGLQIHEPPYLSVSRRDRTPLAPGHVFTVEPGLYFPEKGFGVRIEDVVAIHQDGSVENLTPFSKEILVPLKGRPVKTV